MSRRIPVVLAALFFSVQAVALPVDAASPSNAAPAAGIFSLTLEWNAAMPLPSGVLIACRARVTPLSPFGASVQPIEASVMVPGSGGQCALEIPLAWRGGAVPVNATVDYELAIVTASGTLPLRTGSRTVAVGPASNARLDLAVR